MTNDVQRLSHSKWNCKYHIVFAPKFRGKEIYGKIKIDIGQILRKLCEQKGVKCAALYPSELECGPVYGLPEEQKFADDL